MKDINFLPHWYIDKKVNACRRISMAVMILLVLVNTALAYSCISGSYKIYTIEKKMVEKDIRPVESDTGKDIGAIRSMDVFISDFTGKFDYENVSIDGMSLGFEVPYGNKNDYYMLVKQIEESGNYRVISISQTGDIKGASRLRVKLEVKP